MMIPKGTFGKVPTSILHNAKIYEELLEEDIIEEGDIAKIKGGDEVHELFEDNSNGVVGYSVRVVDANTIDKWKFYRKFYG